MKCIRHLLLIVCVGFLFAACSGSADDTAPGDDDTQPGGDDTTIDDDTQPDDDDTNGSDRTDEDIEVDGNSNVSCDGSPQVMRGGVAGRSILCAFDHHDGNTTAGMKNLEGHDDEEEDGEALVYQFNPSAWDLDALADESAGEAVDDSNRVLSFTQLSNFVYEQGLEAGVIDDEDVVRELSDAFARDIVDTTHSCVATYLEHYEVMFDCLDQVTPVIACDDENLPPHDNGTSCSDHNGTVADWVKSYLTAIGALGDGDEREFYEDIVANGDFSESILEMKVTMADLRFYQYYYAKRDWDTVNVDGTLESHNSFLNPNHWAEYPLIAESTESDCAGADVPRCCEYNTYINTYDSDPAELLSRVNSCTNEFENLGVHEVSQLYKMLLHHDGSVGNDGAFTIDEFFRPFILHYEKTTPPGQRGVCYWEALREFAFRTIQVDAGNASMEMNARDMDTYIQLYDTTIADYDGAEPVAAVDGVCALPED